MINDWKFGKEMVKDERISSLNEWSDEMEVLSVICDFFDYRWQKYEDGRIVLDGRCLHGNKIQGTDSIYGNCDWLGADFAGHIEAGTAKEMCLKFLDSFENCEEMWVNYFTDVITFIKTLQ